MALRRNPYADAAAMLGRFRDQLDEIERTNDAMAKRQIIELLVARIRVDTILTDGRKEARLTISYTFAPERQALDGFSMGTPTTEPYSVQEPS